MRLVGEARKSRLAFVVADLFRHDSIAKLLVEKRNGNNPEPEALLGSDFELEASVKADLLAEVDNLDATDVRSQDIESIWPVTNIQEKVLVEGIRPVASFSGESPVDCITSGQLATYVYMDIGAKCDVSFLERCCARTLERFPALRSCFLRLRGKLWQVVLRELRSPVRVQDVNQDIGIDDYLHDFCLKEARELLPEDPPFSLMVARHPLHGVRLIFRISHAQFDGICLPTIIQSLVGGDDETALSPPAPPCFSTYLAHISRCRTQSIIYWKKVLHGSQPTEIRSRLNPQPLLPAPHGNKEEDAPPKAIRVYAEMDLTHRSGKITSATLVSTAWALLLSFITGKDDVVYGHLVSGRNAAFSGVEDIVGCLVNIVPVRVGVSKASSPADLLLAVQEQFFAMGEADSLGMRDIVDNCASWAPGSMFDSIIQHQNINEEPAVRSQEGVSRLQWFVNPELVPKCVYMISHPKERKLGVQLSANTHIMSMEAAKMLVSDLLYVIGELAASDESPLQPWMDKLGLGLQSRLANRCAI